MLHGTRLDRGMAPFRYREGRRGARWGMTEGRLAEVFGLALNRLPGRWG